MPVPLQGSCNTQARCAPACVTGMWMDTGVTGAGCLPPCQPVSLTHASEGAPNPPNTADAEAQVTRLQQQLQQQQQQAASLEAQLREAQSQLAAWQGKDAELAAARREVELLVERMFAAPAWRASPRMNELGDTMRALDGQAAEVRRQRSTCSWLLLSFLLFFGRVEAGASLVPVKGPASVPPYTSSHPAQQLSPTTSAAPVHPLLVQAGGQASRFARGVQLLQGASRGLQEALQALSRTQMMGAINMGRGAGFQRRTGQRARQMPGRQFGVRLFSMPRARLCGQSHTCGQPASVN